MPVFQLKSLIISSRRNCNGGYEVRERDCGLFDCREKAETSICTVIRENTRDKFFAFFIYERELNPNGQDEGFLSVSSYHPDGTLYCDSPYDEACRKKFRGRTAVSIKLKTGDLGWYWWGNTIEPCLVFGTPLTCREYAAMCRKCGKDPEGADAVALDYSDDSYGVYNYRYDHNHPAAWQLFPCKEAVTQRNMARLLETKQWWEDGCPENRKNRKIKAAVPLSPK